MSKFKEFFVKIKSERDEHGLGMYRVIGASDNQYTVTHHGLPYSLRKGFNIYKAHCHSDKECKAANDAINKKIIGKFEVAK